MYASATKQSRFIHLECDEPLFQSSYKRNNKSSGHKNLRCFPHCCKTHNAHGYCGSTLLIETTIVQSDLIVFAKFDLEASNAINIGDVVPQVKFEPSTSLTGDTWIKAKQIENPTFEGYIPGRQIFEINSKRNSWHYGWVSSRFVKSNVQHQMKVFILAPVVQSPGNLVCLDVLCSMSFRIESTRTGAKQLKALNLSKKSDKVKSERNLSISTSSSPEMPTIENRAPLNMPFYNSDDPNMFNPLTIQQRRSMQFEPLQVRYNDPWKRQVDMELPFTPMYRPPPPFQMMATDSLFSDKDFLDTIINDMQQDDTTPRGTASVVPIARRF
ncbi:hypothetical protein THRCLA_01904 [Thraustotheca clavata]|uniref:Uncharacterized protein n=1 Tax=Thraustotheca clavata TaxID=74557 RepID=A0A1W0A6X3_9STRA|nr:hypothetical protein THRCLA_01904 [Thraustotheca clavata]